MSHAGDALSQHVKINRHSIERGELLRNAHLRARGPRGVSSASAVAAKERENSPRGETVTRRGNREDIHLARMF